MKNVAVSLMTIAIIFMLTMKAIVDTTFVEHPAPKNCHAIYYGYDFYGTACSIEDVHKTIRRIIYRKKEAMNIKTASDQIKAYWEEPE